MDFHGYLTAADLEIMRLLDRGVPAERICEAGWWRMSWLPADVARVDALRRQLATSREVAAGREAAEREARAKTGMRWDDCGTPAAEKRHRKHRQQPCEPCRRARNAYNAEVKRRRREEAKPRPGCCFGCGTTDGYQRHRKQKEETCIPCRRAWSNYQNEYRSRGKAS